MNLASRGLPLDGRRRLRRPPALSQTLSQALQGLHPGKRRAPAARDCYRRCTGLGWATLRRMAVAVRGVAQLGRAPRTLCPVEESTLVEMRIASTSLLR